MVDDGKDGFIVPIRDPKSIADKLQYFKDNPTEIKIMGQRARMKTEKYSWTKIEQRYAKIYQELI